MKNILVLMLLMFSAVTFAETKYKVAVHESKPFMYKENGVWVGSDYDLLNDLSEEMDFKYEMIEYATIPEVLESIQSGETDMAISSLSVNSKREKVLDFTHPYMATGIGILVEKKGNTYETIMGILSKIIAILAVYIILFYVVGAFYKLAEREDRTVPLHQGAYFAVMVFSTVGLGDEAPKTPGGKFLTAVWIMISIFLISIMSGSISSSMTVSKMADTPIGVHELSDMQVVTIVGSTSDEYLTEQGISHITVKTADGAMYLVEKGDAQAFVYDKAILDNYTKYENYNVWMIPNTIEYYAIALQQGSDKMEEFNIAITKMGR